MIRLKIKQNSYFCFYTMLLITFEKETIIGAINDETNRRMTGDNGERMQLNDKDYERLTLSIKYISFLPPGFKYLIQLRKTYY